MRNKRKESSLRIFIFAGGRSSRMGRDKSRLLLGSRNFLDRIIATARELEVPVDIIDRDDQPGLGPLGGVATAYRRFEFERGLFLSCDMPLINADLLRQLLEQPTTRARFTQDNGRAGFPFVLPRSAEGVVSILINRRLLSIQELSSALNAESFTAERADRWQLLNVNTPQDYRDAVNLWTRNRMSDAVLEIRNLTVQRGKTQMVSNFTWQVRKGEHWAVLGSNGCGKTSLFSSLLGYLTPTKGDIFVLGEEYGDSDWPKLRTKIGLVSSSIRQMMPEHEPAWITVASGKYAMVDFWGTPGRKDKTEAFELLRQIECEYMADRPWAFLSQGERQRVLIARALIAKPALLILDEPCAGLDPAAREHFLQFLDRLGRSRNSPALVLVTHHVEEVMPVFTHVLLMKQGRKLAEGPVGKMISSARLSETFQTRIQCRKANGRYSLRFRPERSVII